MQVLSRKQINKFRKKVELILSIYSVLLENNPSRPFCEEERKEKGKRRIHRETGAKLLSAKHKHKECLVLTRREIDSDTIITHSMFTELYIYTSLGFVPTTFIPIHISYYVLRAYSTLNLSTRHRPFCRNSSSDYFMTGMRGR